MAVIITNMDMPKSCEECPFGNSSQDNCSLLWIDSIRNGSTDCPLKSVNDFVFEDFCKQCVNRITPRDGMICRHCYLAPVLYSYDKELDDEK